MQEIFDRAKMRAAEDLRLALHHLKSMEVALEGRHGVATKTVREALLRLASLPRDIERGL